MVGSARMKAVSQSGGGASQDGRIGPPARDAVPLLIPLLGKASDAAAAQALGAIGPDAKEAVPALFELAKGTPPLSPVRRALVGIGEGAARP